MDAFVLKIGDVAHWVAGATISAHCVEQDGEPCLSVSLFADSQDLTKPGFALNCLAFAGLRMISELQGASLSVVCGREAPLNDLGESVICEPGRVLELDSLSLTFGRLSGGQLPVQMQAICRAGGQRIPTTASFNANVKS